MQLVTRSLEANNFFLFTTHGIGHPTNIVIHMHIGTLSGAKPKALKGKLHLGGFRSLVQLSSPIQRKPISGDFLLVVYICECLYIQIHPGVCLFRLPEHDDCVNKLWAKSEIFRSVAGYSSARTNNKLLHVQILQIYTLQ